MYPISFARHRQSLLLASFALFALLPSCSGSGPPRRTRPATVDSSDSAASAIGAASATPATPHRFAPTKALKVSDGPADIPRCTQVPALADLHHAPSFAVATGRAGERYALVERPVDTHADVFDTEVALLRLDPGGAERWRIDLGRVHVHLPAPWPIAVASNGDVVVAGAFEGTIEIGGVRLVSPVPSLPIEPVPYVLRVAPDGTLRWAHLVARQPAALVTGLSLALDGTAFVAITSAERIVARDGVGELLAVDPAGRVGSIRRLEGQLRALTMLPDGSLVIGGARQGPRGAAFVSVMSPSGANLESLEIPAAARPSTEQPRGAEPHVALALAATPQGDLWTLLSESCSVALNIELEPHESDPGLLLVKLDRGVNRVKGAYAVRELRGGDPDVLGAADDGGVLVGHTAHRFAALPSRERPDTGWFTLHASADGVVSRVPLIDTDEGILGHADVVTALTMADVDSPVATLRSCLRPCDQLCRQYGWCDYRDVGNGLHACVATSPNQCASSAHCRSRGECSVVGSRCAPTHARECRSSTACALEGACTPGRLRCVAGSEQHCRQSRACRDEGRCSFTPDSGPDPSGSGPRCVAKSDAECRRARTCREEGRCFASPELDYCEARTADDCQRSTGCVQSGRCSLGPKAVPFVPALCMPLIHADCRRSQGCAERGACSLEAHTPGSLGANVVTICRLQADADCLITNACRRHGKCRLADRQCVK